MDTWSAPILIRLSAGEAARGAADQQYNEAGHGVMGQDCVTSHNGGPQGSGVS